MITEIPLHVLRMFSSPSPPFNSLIGVTSHTTPLSIRRGAGGEASVFSVCRRPSVGSKCAPKTSVNSVRSVREKTPQRIACVSSHRVGAFSLSQIYTEEQNTQHFTETLSRPISQNLTPNIHHPTPIRSLTQHKPKKEKELTTNTSKPFLSYQHSISFSISGIVSRLKTGLFTPARFCCR